MCLSMPRRSNWPACRRWRKASACAFEVETDQKGSKAVKLRRASADSETANVSDTAISSSSAAPSTLDLTIYHNPDCETSRNTLTALRMAGHEPRIIEYLKTPPTKSELKTLAQNMKLSVRDVVRKLEPLYVEGLDGDGVDDDTLLEAMVKSGPDQPAHRGVEQFCPHVQAQQRGEKLLSEVSAQ